MYRPYHIINGMHSGVPNSAKSDSEVANASNVLKFIQINTLILSIRFSSFQYIPKEKNPWENSMLNGNCFLQKITEKIKIFNNNYGCQKWHPYLVQ